MAWSGVCMSSAKEKYHGSEEDKGHSTDERSQERRDEDCKEYETASCGGPAECFHNEKGEYLGICQRKFYTSSEFFMLGKVRRNETTHTASKLVSIVPKTMAAKSATKSRRDPRSQIIVGDLTRVVI